MAHATNTQEMLLQNLKDAGCSQQMLESCVALFLPKNTLEMKRLLAGHRRELLEAIHIHLERNRLSRLSCFQTRPKPHMRISLNSE